MIPNDTAKSYTHASTANFTQDRVTFQALRELHYGQSVIKYHLLWRTMRMSKLSLFCVSVAPRESILVMKRFLCRGKRRNSPEHSR